MNTISTKHRSFSLVSWMILLTVGVPLFFSQVDRREPLNAEEPAALKGNQAAIQKEFRDPERVHVDGYDDHLMEPGISKNGNYLLWNDGPPNKDVHWAVRIDDTHFSYRGKVSGINSDTVDGTPSFDLAGNLYYTSLVNYPETKKSIYSGTFKDGKVTNIRLLDGDIYVGKKPWISLDPEISPGGDMLYYSEGLFDGGPMPSVFNVRAARKVGNRYVLDKSITASVNTDDLEYAPAISADDMELFFTRINLTNGKPSGNGIYIARRDDVSKPFGPPRRINVIKGGFVEAPTITLDGKNLYYHLEEGGSGGRFVLYRVTRETSLDAELSLSNENGSTHTQYLAFQIFTTGGFDSEKMRTVRQNFPPPTKNIADTVEGLVRTIGMVGSGNKKLGFVPGPLTFDQTDEEIRELMQDSFAIALKNNIAVGFHIDDSMFWGRLSHLNTIENIEWLDWNKTPNTGRRLDWSSNPTKIMPQLCFNSPAVKEEVKKRAILIGEEVKRGLESLKAANKEDLFVGVIAGWETQIGRDFETGKYLGYGALTNKGYSAKNPPANMDEARTDIVKDFIDFWTGSLAAAGVPEEKMFSHIACMSKAVFDSVTFGQPGRFPGSYFETINFTPPRVAFGPRHHAGFSTYPQIGFLGQIQAERVKNGNPPWASAEGTAIDPSAAERGMKSDPMEEYLGSLFNHGAVFVNIFGWGVGPSSNPFRKVAENKRAIAAYQKFLQGEKLIERAQTQTPSSQFFSKTRKLQKELPPYLKEHGPGKIGALYETLKQHLDAQRYTDAEENIDKIFKMIEE